MPSELSILHAWRLSRWGQTAETRITGPEMAAKLIERVGVASLFAASPEIPDLYHAYMGDPAAKSDSEWDSPAGDVYGWRWELGRPGAAFYTALVYKRPTWISWEMLPAILRLCAELRTPDELYRAGQLSANAYKIAQALDASDSVTLSTGELRQQAGFPTGKTQRAAYLKAVEELDTRLIVAKAFLPDDTEMRHTLVSRRYPQYLAAAEKLTRPQALEQFLLTYLPNAVYTVPGILAKHLKLPEAELREGLKRLVDMGRAIPLTFAEYKGECYAWKEEGLN